jgi:hypothetical protein
MKRIFVILAGLLAIASVSKADDRPVRFEELPKAAQKFVKVNFPDNIVLYASKDDDIMFPEYEVGLDNGINIDFRNDGQLEKIQARQTGVPAAIIPVKIREYVTAHYPGVKILEYEVDRNGYEIKVSNGLEMKFSLTFHLVEIDD